jgi:hypothetical protein
MIGWVNHLQVSFLVSSFDLMLKGHIIKYFGKIVAMEPDDIDISWIGSVQYILHSVGICLFGPSA